MMLRLILQIVNLVTFLGLAIFLSYCLTLHLPVFPLAIMSLLLVVMGYFAFVDFSPYVKRFLK